MYSRFAGDNCTTSVVYSRLAGDNCTTSVVYSRLAGDNISALTLTRPGSSSGEQPLRLRPVSTMM